MAWHVVMQCNVRARAFPRGFAEPRHARTTHAQCNVPKSAHLFPGASPRRSSPRWATARTMTRAAPADGAARSPRPRRPASRGGGRSGDDGGAGRVCVVMMEVLLKSHPHHGRTRVEMLGGCWAAALSAPACLLLAFSFSVRPRAASQGAGNAGRLAVQADRSALADAAGRGGPHPKRPGRAQRNAQKRAQG